MVKFTDHFYMRQKLLRLYDAAKIYLLQNTSTKQTLIKNFMWLIGGEGVSKSLIFFVTVWIARYLGVGEYGKFSFAFTFVGLFSIIIDFGFNVLTVREVSRNESLASKYIGNILVFKVLLSIITLGIVYFMIGMMNKQNDVRTLVFLATFYSILQSFILFFQAVFQAFEKMQHNFISRIISSLSLFLLVFIVVQKNLGIQLLVISYIASSLITFFFVFILTKKFFTYFSLEIDLQFWNKLLKNSLPFVLSSGAVMIYYRIDSLLINIFRNDEAVGYYTAAYNVIILLITIVALFGSVIMPALSKLFTHSKDKFFYSVTEMTEMVILFSLPLIGIVYFNAPLIISIIYGEKFLNVTPALLQILIWSVLVLYSYAVIVVGLTASNRQNIYMKGVSIGAIFNVLLNLVLIPLYSSYGAAFATVLTEIIICIYMTRKFIQGSTISLRYSELIKIVIAGTLFFSSIIVLRNSLNISYIIASIMSIISYIVCIKLLHIKVFNIRRLISL
jgi:O-antigen/teichoic acid export membrane protein